MGSNSLKELLDDGVITQYEYENLSTRMEAKKQSSELIIREVLLGFKSFLVDEYSTSTANGYTQNVEKFIEFMFSVDKLGRNEMVHRLPAFSSQDVIKWFNHLQANGYSYSSIKRFKHSVKRFFQFMTAKYGMNLPSVDYIEIPKPDVEVEIDALTDGEIRNIANYATTLRDKLIILVMYECGMRRQELIECKKKDIDWNKNRVLIKDIKEKRIGIITDETKELLQQYISEWRDEIEDINENRHMYKVTRGIKYNKLEESEFVFQTSRSPQMSYAVIFKALKDASHEYYLNMFIKEGMESLVAEEMAKEKTSTFNTETLRHSKRAYLFSQKFTVDQVQVAMGDENYWVCKRYLKIAQQLYPESFTN